MGRPHIELDQADLHKDILAIVLPNSSADEKRRSEVYNSVQTLDDLHAAVQQKGYTISRTATYYRLIPRDARHIDGKRHVHTVPVRLLKPQNNKRKHSDDSHFAMASVKFAKELASLFHKDHVFFLSQDDKARVPMGLPISKKQTCVLMHLEYKVQLLDHDFPLGEKAKLIPSVYASLVKKKDGTIGYSGPTYIGIRSAKLDKSSAASHATDFKRLVKLEEFKESAINNGSVKPLVFVSVDGGPDEAPKNQLTKLSWVKIFLDLLLDGLWVFTHAPGNSAYNEVERRMAPLSKQTSGNVLF